MDKDKLATLSGVIAAIGIWLKGQGIDLDIPVELTAVSGSTALMTLGIILLGWLTNKK